MSQRPMNTSDSKGPGSSGFRAQLRDVSLLDLVQMACLAMTRRVVRVSSGRAHGFLYFDRGRIVHAVTGSQRGEEAAIEMLLWEGGAFEPAAATPWPRRETIHCPPQHLLMRATLARDNSSRTKVVPLPVSHPKDETPRSHRRTTPPPDVPFVSSIRKATYCGRRVNLWISLPRRRTPSSFRSTSVKLSVWMAFSASHRMLGPAERSSFAQSRAVGSLRSNMTPALIRLRS